MQKCKQMVITRKKASHFFSKTFWSMGKPPWNYIVDTYKYLGVWITSDLSWARQIEEICKKANQKVGFIYRRFNKYCSTNTLKCLYVALVCPHLDYAVPEWDPHLTKYIDHLEKVQKFSLIVCTKTWNMT